MKWVYLACACMTLAALTKSEEQVLEEESERNDRLLVGLVRTHMVTVPTTTTITVAAVTCYKNIDTGTCTGKRKKRTIPVLTDMKEEIEPSSKLSSSQAELEDVETSDLGSDPSQKLVFRKTMSTTVTFTSSSTTAGVTLSLSYACTVSGMSLPPAC